jgi:fructosamine-3-kinase
LTHPLMDPMIIAAVERAATAHRGRQWACSGFTDLNDRAAHPCGILHGVPFSVFAKLTSASDGQAQFTAELAGLRLISALSPVATPTPLATAIIEIPASAPAKGEIRAADGTGAAGDTTGRGSGCLLLFEALPERTGRSPDDFRAIGRALATLHEVHHTHFGLADFDGFFGPLPQDNRPVPANTWPDFYAGRRVRPMLRIAVDSGNLPVELALGVERLLDRLPDLSGPDVRPSLLHGDAQQNNFLCPPADPRTPYSAVVIDACPYFGHPEIDLALVDYFESVPAELFNGYGEIRPIDEGFAERRELWRVFAYLAVISADGQDYWGRQQRLRLADAIGRFS